MKAAEPSPSALRTMAEEKVVLVTVLPLKGIGYVLNGGNKREELGNGYAVVDSNSLPALEKFDEEYMTKILSQSEWSQVRYAPLCLRVSYECSLEDGVQGIEAKGSEYCGEKLDGFLLALNIKQKLWSFRPDVRLSWFDNDYPLSQQNIKVRHYSPISTFEDRLTLEDFREAAQLTAKIDEVYLAGDNDGEAYPAVRTAFDAIRLGAYAFNTSMRFLQEAIALESLCSTDTAEVAHKIGVACAVCLGANLEERKELYRQAKDLYAIRSRVIHGSGRRVTREQLVQIEQLSRRLLRYVLNDDVLPKFRTRDAQREYLLDLALRGS